MYYFFNGIFFFNLIKDVFCVLVFGMVLVEIEYFFWMFFLKFRRKWMIGRVGICVFLISVRGMFYLGLISVGVIVMINMD